MICPECKGYGKSQGFYITANRQELPCPICKGSGELPADIEYDPERGQKIKELRIENQLTLRHFSHITGIDATILSEQEKGLFRQCQIL